MKAIILSAAIILAGICVNAQDIQPIKVSAYLETYYGYDFNKPTNNTRPGFVYSHNRHNEFNLNLGYLKAAFENENVRANIAVMAGTYTNANYAAEPGVLKNIFEANVGVKLSKNANLWIDAGIFTSHIGFESALSKDCWVLTRNISSENTPYYESGAKLTYITANGKFTLSGLYLNGWQRIARPDSSTGPAGGLQLVFKPNDRITLNYSNYLGTEGMLGAGVRRFYNNVYGIFQLNKQVGITAGFDYGLQQKSKGSSNYSKVLSPVLIARYQFASKWTLAGRVEYYKDKDGVLIVAPAPGGFNVKGYSLNIDFWPVSNTVLRIEGKLYDSRDAIFVKNKTASNTNTAVTASMAVSF